MYLKTPEKSWYPETLRPKFDEIEWNQLFQVPSRLKTICIYLCSGSGWRPNYAVLGNLGFYLEITDWQNVAYQKNRTPDFKTGPWALDLRSWKRTQEPGLSDITPNSNTALRIPECQAVLRV